MDPNNNQPIQPINPNPIDRPIMPPQPVVPQPVIPQQPAAVPQQPMMSQPVMPTPEAVSFQTQPQPTPSFQAPVPPPVMPTMPPIPTPVMTPPLTPKQGSKLPILLVILIILILGMGYYIMFAKNKIEMTQKAATENTSVVVPTATITPTVTPAAIDQINVASPDADLNGLDKDVQGL